MKWGLLTAQERVRVGSRDARYWIQGDLKALEEPVRSEPDSAGLYDGEETGEILALQLSQIHGRLRKTSSRTGRKTQGLTGQSFLMVLSLLASYGGQQNKPIPRD